MKSLSVRGKRRAVKGALVACMAMFAVAFILSGTHLYRMMRDYVTAGRLYASLAAQYAPVVPEKISEGTPDGERAGFVSPVDFDALREINPDVVAWVHVPGTGINYPVVHTDDNEKYLNTSYDGKANRCGAIFLDYLNGGDFSDRHVILYGHNMRDGSMFAQLNRFKQQAFFGANREARIYTPERTYRLVIFSTYAQRADIRIRRVRFDDDLDFKKYVQWVLECSYFDAGIEADDIEQLFTLGTCSYEWSNARTWVHAALIR
jgi:sortase B